MPPARACRRSIPSCASRQGCVDFRSDCLRPRELPEARELAQPACERCGAAACAAPPRNASRPPVRWLHIPKCGSSLATTVLGYACASTVPAWHAVYMAMAGGQVDVRMGHALRARHDLSGARCDGALLLPFTGHHALRPAEARVVAMFRRPAQRLVSAFLDNMHTWGMPRAHKNLLRARGHPPTAAEFARHPGVAGCMAKMLAGHDCGAVVELGGSLVRRAVEVVRTGAVAFVGLTEEWDASVCLFHAVLGARTAPLRAEFRNFGHSRNRAKRSLTARNGACRLRASGGRCYDELLGGGRYNESVLDGFVDAADEAVYAEAVAVFRRQLDAFPHARRLLIDERALLEPSRPSTYTALLRTLPASTGAIGF